ncbi:hypothetical protein JL720_603 [Aureococcus anophagefferens]|nr:hypothetical protein JL720_603 [Aureococcus anophagefferens]
MAHLGLGSPSPVAPASPGRYLAGSPQTFASAVPESGAVAVEDDKRYRRSIHALEAEVEEARVEIARLRDALRAATAEAADARGERAPKHGDAVLREFSRRAKAASDAKHECARLRSACRSAQSDAERCVKVAEAAAEAATKREEENKREFLRQRHFGDGGVSEDRVKALTAELEGDRDRYAATLAKTTAMVDQRIEEVEAEYARERSATDARGVPGGARPAGPARAGPGLRGHARGEPPRVAGRRARDADARRKRRAPTSVVALERQGAALEAKVATAENATSDAESRLRFAEQRVAEDETLRLAARPNSRTRTASADAERVCASAEVHRQSLERRADEADRRREAAEAAALEANALAATARLAEAQGARLEAELGAQDARRDAERALGAAKNAALEVEAAKAEASRLKEALEDAKRTPRTTPWPSSARSRPRPTPGG